MKKIYYAHSMHIYNTPQEERDVTLLKDLGFEILNPNTEQVQKDFNKMRDTVPDNMNFFENLVEQCDAVAFRPLMDGSIPAGVGREIQRAHDIGLPIIELPNLLSTRFLSVADTRMCLSLNGQR